MTNLYELKLGKEKLEALLALFTEVKQITEAIEKTSLKEIIGLRDEVVRNANIAKEAKEQVVSSLNSIIELKKEIDRGLGDARNYFALIKQHTDNITALINIAKQEIGAVNLAVQTAKTATQSARDEAVSARDSAKATKSEVDVLHNNAVAINKDIENKESTIRELISSFSRSLNFKGIIPKYASLPSNPETGDMYKIDDTKEVYMWDSLSWQKIDGNLNIETFLTKVEYADIDTKLVHKTGDETIVGNKKFKNKVEIDTTMPTFELTNSVTNKKWLVAVDADSFKIKENNTGFDRLTINSGGNLKFDKEIEAKKFVGIASNAQKFNGKDDTDFLHSSKPLNATSNLNEVISEGIWNQNYSVNATTTNNYPIAEAGMLIVGKSTGTHQIYITYNYQRVFSRAKYLGKWSAWVEIMNRPEVEAITNTKLGKTEKAIDSDKLDGLDALQFLRSDKTNKLKVDGGQVLLTTTTPDASCIQAFSADESDSGTLLITGRNSAKATRIEFKTDVFTNNNQKILTEADGKAVDSSKLNGSAESVAFSSNSIAKRDGSGDLFAGYFNHKFTSSDSLFNSSARILFTNSDGYIRQVSQDKLKSLDIRIKTITYNPKTNVVIYNPNGMKVRGMSITHNLNTTAYSVSVSYHNWGNAANSVGITSRTSNNVSFAGYWGGDNTVGSFTPAEMSVTIFY